MAGIGHNSHRNQNIIRSNPEKGFTKLSNAFLQDSRVSYETRGLLAEILSRPDDWEVTIASLVSSGAAGRDKVYRMMQEAVKCGYADPKKHRRADGSFQRHSYRVSDDPKLLIERVATEIMAIEEAALHENEAAQPLPEKPDMAKPEVDGQQAISGKSGSGGDMSQPLPENPDTAKPTHTNKRKLQRKDSNPSLRSGLGADAPSPDDLTPSQDDLPLPADDPTPPPPVPDAKDTLWRDGLDWLAQTSGKRKDSLRSLIGRWLKVVSAAELLDFMRAAAKARTADPIGYIGGIVEQHARAARNVRRENGRILVFNGFKTELAQILAGRDFQRALDQIAGRIPIGVSGLDLEARVRGLAAEMVERAADHDRRYAAAVARNAREGPPKSLTDQRQNAANAALLADVEAIRARGPARPAWEQLEDLGDFA